MASQEYHDYIQSEQWQKVRVKRLALGKFRCAACGSRESLEVHHLTYVRLFQERMEDLLPLCRLHHLAAEEMVLKGLLPRSDDVVWLATETIRLIISPDKMVDPRRNGAGRDLETRNTTQEELLSLSWFHEALKLEQRSAFKRLVKKNVKGNPKRQKMIVNALTLYNRQAKPSHETTHKIKPTSAASSELNMVTLSRQLLHSAGRNGVGFKRRQLELLAVPWPPKRGWLSALIGKDIQSDIWDRVMALKGSEHSK